MLCVVLAAATSVVGSFSEMLLEVAGSWPPFVGSDITDRYAVIDHSGTGRRGSEGDPRRAETEICPGLEATMEKRTSNRISIREELRADMTAGSKRTPESVESSECIAVEHGDELGNKRVPLPNYVKRPGPIP